MDMINHIHYVSDLLVPKDFDWKKATRTERLNALASADINSEACKKAVAFFKEHGTVIDPTIAFFEMQFRPASEPPTQMEPGIARVAPALQEPLTSGGMLSKGKGLIRDREPALW
jgi:hypothetical protein